MEKRRRKNRTNVSIPSEVKKSNSEITFEAFFIKCVSEGKLKNWQQKEIAAFFKDLKLRDKEDLEIYEQTLKKY